MGITLTNLSWDDLCDLMCGCPEDDQDADADQDQEGGEADGNS